MPSSSRISLYAFVLSFGIVFCTAFFFFPKWKKTGTEATISWDVSGYYLYLPATFIYKDLKQCSFFDSIITKYQPTSNFQQAFTHDSGNKVMKYSAGQAVQYLPFFTIAHFWALNSDYPPDGFSYPYQFSLSMGSLFMAFIGLYFLRKVLLCYFSDKVSAITLLLIVIGTNYLNYSAIDGAMTHNYLFTWYAILIHLTIRFYTHPTVNKSVAIGFVVGIIALTRPTEIISMHIPLLWGVNLLSKESVFQRFYFLKNNYLMFCVAVFTCILVGSLQLIYWHYVSGEWLVYSYGEFGFSWLHPHIKDGLLSYNSGWLIYTPLMFFALVGFYFLIKTNKSVGYPILLFILIFIYIVFSWDIWWYGGSLGQRTMVQVYPLLAFPLASFLAFLARRKIVIKVFIGCIMALCVYFNIWVTYQAHEGGLFNAEYMSKEYYWKVIFRYDNNINDKKLLDNKEEFLGIPQNKQILVKNAFKTPFTLDSKNQYSDTLRFTNNIQKQWLRLSADVKLYEKEWHIWDMTQMTVVFYDQNGKKIKQNMIRLHRLLNAFEQKNLYLDATLPKDCAYFEIFFWNGRSPKPIDIKNVTIEAFDE